MFRRHFSRLVDFLEKLLKRARPSVTRRCGPVVRPSIDFIHIQIEWGQFKRFAANTLIGPCTASSTHAADKRHRRQTIEPSLSRLTIASWRHYARRVS